jgi:hypothetical protein
MHGMGWDGISSRGSPLLHDREWPLCSVGHPSARVCTRTSGVWLHVSMELGIGRVIWVGCGRKDGRFRRTITGGTYTY